jgi:hypothetical protein
MLFDFLRPYISQLTVGQQDILIQFLSVTVLIFIPIYLLFFLRDKFKKSKPEAEEKSLSEEDKKTINEGSKVFGKAVLFFIALAIVLWFFGILGESWEEVQTRDERCLKLDPKYFSIKEESDRVYKMRFRLTNTCSEDFMVSNIRLEIMEGNYVEEENIISYLENFDGKETKYMQRKIYLDKEEYANQSYYKWIIRIGDTHTFQIKDNKIRKAYY